ncbi:MAG: hypothetical protein EOP21_00770 [Hyphomicrobiales bacterium]|nr:MAG: hypothetical protein EOP21_00770 [Hyphomicrobiales bacterium]
MIIETDPIACRGGVISPEQRLFRGVIVNAAMEAAGVSALPDKSGDKDRAQRAALAWFTRTNKDFNTVCSLAGLEPAFVRTKVSLFLERAAADPSLTRRRGGPVSVH